MPSCVKCAYCDQACKSLQAFSCHEQCKNVARCCKCCGSDKTKLCQTCRGSSEPSVENPLVGTYHFSESEGGTSWESLTITLTLDEDGTGSFHECDVADRDTHTREDLKGTWMLNGRMVAFTSETACDESCYNYGKWHDSVREKFFVVKPDGNLEKCSREGKVVSSFRIGYGTESKTNFLVKH